MDKNETGSVGGTASAEVVYAPNIEAFILTNDGVFPNNPRLPLLIYKKALNTEIPDLVSHVQAIFADHHWGNSWIDSIYISTTTTAPPTRSWPSAAGRPRSSSAASTGSSRPSRPAT